jgi:hypothetical protein
MRKNVTIGFSPEEFLRVQGAAVVAGVPVATYVRWLLQSRSAVNCVASHMTTILERLDALRGMSKRPTSQEARPGLPTQSPATPPRDEITAKLRERGLPSSTIRQVNAVLDELGGCK